MRLISIFLCAIVFNVLFNSDLKGASLDDRSEIIEKIRPTLNSILGEELTEKILTHPWICAEEEVKMPKIPAVNQNAKSVEVYNRAKDQISIDPKVEVKYNYFFIKELFNVVKSVNPREEEIAQFMNVLSQGGTREGVYRSLVLNADYAELEFKHNPPKKLLVNFIVKFYEKFFARKVDQEKLLKMNFYSLKRVVVEKALEVLDAFGHNREDAESWYALFSKELATITSQNQLNTLRQNKSALAHKKWAQNVPLQHIKSELIIKMHSTFNSLSK